MIMSDCDCTLACVTRPPGAGSSDRLAEGTATTGALVLFLPSLWDIVDDVVCLSVATVTGGGGDGVVSDGMCSSSSSMAKESCDGSASESGGGSES